MASRPEVEVEASNFELQEETLPPLEPGNLLLKARYLGVNPPMRMALVSGGIAGRPIPIGLWAISVGSSTPYPMVVAAMQCARYRRQRGFPRPL